MFLFMHLTRLFVKIALHLTLFQLSLKLVIIFLHILELFACLLISLLNICQKIRLFFYLLLHAIDLVLK